MQHDFILLDRSGSMASMWVEALASINGYVKRLAAENVDTGVTLATFDAEDVIPTAPSMRHETRMLFEVIRDRITPKTWREVSSVDAKPRGWTPLSDAIGKIVDLAERGNYDKVAILIMTDGEENSSRELSVDDAKRMLDRCRARNWQVIFLGADFDNVRQARGYNVSAGATLSASRGTMRQHTNSLSGKRAVYGATGEAVNFTEEEKAELNQVPPNNQANKPANG